MKNYRYSLLSLAIKIALFFPGLSCYAEAASSCGKTETLTTIQSGTEKDPCNLINDESLLIEKSAAIAVPQGESDGFDDPYNMYYSAVNVGNSDNSGALIAVKQIKNNGTLSGSRGLTVSYTGSLGKLLNYEKMTGNEGAIWISGKVDTVDNYNLLESTDTSGVFYAIGVYDAQGSNTTPDMKGSVNEIMNRQGGTVEGIYVGNSTVNTINNHGKLTSFAGVIASDGATLFIASGDIKAINNYESITSIASGIIVEEGGSIGSVNNISGSKGITADKDAIQVILLSTPNPNTTQEKKSSQINQVTNDSLLYGKRYGIVLDGQGNIGTITNGTTGIIKGDKYAIYNKGSISGGIYNSGLIDGNIDLGDAVLYISGKGKINGDITGTQKSHIIIGDKYAAEFIFSHDIKNVDSVKVKKDSKFYLGDGKAAGNVSIDIANDGELYFNRIGKAIYDHIISGTGSVYQAGSSTTILSGKNTYTGPTFVQAGTLQLDSWSGTSHTINIDPKGTLALNLAGKSPFGSVLAGQGLVNKMGNGETTFSSSSPDFLGTMNVEAGQLFVADNAQLGGKTAQLNVKKGSTLGGRGKVGGSAIIESGGNLTGTQGSTLTFDHDLTLNDGARVDVSLNSAEGSEPTLFDVLGTLKMAGTLNVENASSLSAGEYDIFHYGDIAPDSAMTTAGGLPGSLSVDIDKAKKIVYLTNTAGKTLNYWAGGDGLWQVEGERNWTSKKGGVKTSWRNADKFAIFGNHAGTVRIDNSKGNVKVDGLQFSTGGYTLTGDLLTLEKGNQGNAVIRVGTSSRSAKEMLATIDAQLTGAVTLEKMGGGTLVFAADNNYSGGTKVTQGTLQLGNGGTQGNLLGDIALGSQGALAFNRSNPFTFGNNISGTGSVYQAGSSTTILSGKNTYTGPTFVQAGTLQLDSWSGTSNTINIDPKGTLALNLAGKSPFGSVLVGQGLVNKMGNGETTFSSSSPDFLGTMNVEAGQLFVADNAQLGGKTAQLNVKKDSTLGGRGKVGGSAIIESGGNLTGTQGSTLTFDHDLALNDGARVDVSLNSAEGSEPTLFDVLGTLKMAGTLNVENASSLSAGEYDIFHYGDIAPDSAMTTAGGLPGSLSVDIDKAKKIVYLTNTAGKTLNYWAGGDGLWQVEGERNWTSKKGGVKTSWRNADKFAIFGNHAGTVRIDNSKGNVKVDGLQFSTGGYTLTGDLLTLEKGNQGNAVIRVGTSSRSAKEMLATIDAQLMGAVTLEKMGGGTLVFAADNNYSGGTKVTQGTLQLGNGGTQGNLFGDIALGSQGALAFNHSNDRVFGGNITGQGSLIKNGNNALVLTGKNSYTGVTEIQQGTFRQGKENAFSADSSYLTGEKTFFDMGGFNTTISGLNHSGHLSFGGDDNAVGRTLTATGDYNGKNGTLNLATKLAGDDSPTDRFVVNGNTSGTTHLVVKNVGGEGAPTHKGIKVVEVNGLSNGEFNLVGDYHHQGDPVIVAGAYAYRLDKDGTDHSWHLRSSKNYKPANPTQPTPPNQLYHAGVSLYEAYGQVLQTLNSPGTLYDRIDSREDRLNNAGSNNVGNDDKNTRSSKAWGRVTGTYGKLSPHKSTSGAENITYYMTRAQVGVDNRLYENDQGAIDGGVFLQYSHINADVGSEHGKGNIRSKGYTVGGTGTWYGHNGFYLGGLAQMTYFSSDLNSKTAGKHLGEEKAALGYALSLEAGQRINLTPTWSFTPQAQLAYSSIRMDDFHDVFKTKVHFGQSNNMKLRVGSVLDYRPKWRDGQNKDKKSPHLYGLFNVRQELLGDSDSAHVANKAFSSRNDRLWGEVGAGGAYSWNNGKYVVYSQTSVNTSLNNAADNYEINAKLGLKIAW